MDVDLGRPDTREANQPSVFLDSLFDPWETVRNSLWEDTDVVPQPLAESEHFWDTDTHVDALRTDVATQASQENPTVGTSSDSILTSVNTPPSATEPSISRTLLEELLTMYFDKVHCFVPIIHRPRFYEQFFPPNSSLSDTDASDLLQDSLLLNGMLALAARFSSSPYFNNMPSTDKGNRFADTAKRIYYKRLQAVQKPSLDFLQGCTLLAYQLYLQGPNTEGWLVIGMCTRLASDMGLNAIDLENESEPYAPVSVRWSKKEELRRVWWSVWELDTFSAAIACRPHTIDRTKMHVKLPVSDENWFANLFVESAIIEPDPLHAWHSLRDSPNQDERAWFLLINYLLLTAHDLGQRRCLQPRDIKEIETAISCYSLLLPSQFHLTDDLNPASFWPNRISTFNWIISTNIMLQGSRVFVKLLNEGVSTPKFWSSSNHLLAPLAAESQLGAPEDKYRIYADQIIRIIRMWPPEFIPYNSPFIGCLILGPAAMHLRVTLSSRQTARGEAGGASLEEELLKLALSQIGRFWRFGSMLLDIANTITSSRESVPSKTA